MVQVHQHCCQGTHSSSRPHNEAHHAVSQLSTTEGKVKHITSIAGKFSELCVWTGRESVELHRAYGTET